MQDKLNVLHQAIDTESPEAVKTALYQVVPTYRTPEEINAKAAEADEMKTVKVS